MTLYQINRKAAPRWSVLEEQVRRLVISNVLVPVEPCEHGNIGEHVIRDQKRTYHPSELCPGAGIGETPVVLDDFENMILDRALDRMEGIGGDE